MKKSGIEPKSLSVAARTGPVWLLLLAGQSFIHGDNRAGIREGNADFTWFPFLYSVRVRAGLCPGPLNPGIFNPLRFAVNIPQIPPFFRAFLRGTPAMPQNKT
jgi:hypothetical protein